MDIITLLLRNEIKYISVIPNNFSLNINSYTKFEENLSKMIMIGSGKAVLMFQQFHSVGLVTMGTNT